MDIIWGYIIKWYKNDHVFHNACLMYLIQFYDKERERIAKPNIEYNGIHTDKCPTQYKYQHNFY